MILRQRMTVKAALLAVTTVALTAQPANAIFPLFAIAAKFAIKAGAKAAIKAGAKAAAKKGGKALAKRAGKHLAKRAGRKIAQKAGRRLAQKAGRKVAQKAGRKVAQKASRKVAQRAAKKASGQVKKKVTNKVKQQAKRQIKQKASKKAKKSSKSKKSKPKKNSKKKKTKKQNNREEEERERPQQEREQVEERPLTGSGDQNQANSSQPTVSLQQSTPASIPTRPIPQPHGVVSSNGPFAGHHSHQMGVPAASGYIAPGAFPSTHMFWTNFQTPFVAPTGPESQCFCPCASLTSSRHWQPSPPPPPQACPEVERIRRRPRPAVRWIDLGDISVHAFEAPGLRFAEYQ